FVIHTVGPVWQGGTQGEPELLASCYRRCLAIAAENEMGSIAFPSISTGGYGYPIERAARVAVDTVRRTLRALAARSGKLGPDRISRPNAELEEVIFCCFSPADYAVYEALLANAAKDLE